MNELVQALVDAIKGAYSLLETHAKGLDELNSALDDIHQAQNDLFREQDDPYMTAVQFSDFNELYKYDVNLNELGKIAKQYAGSRYCKIRHLEYGSIGYVQQSIWFKALEVYFINHDTRLPLRVYVVLKGLTPKTRMLKLAESLLYLLGVGYYEFVDGRRRFTASAQELEEYFYTVSGYFNV